MVTNLKSMDELDEVSIEALVGNAIGREFTYVEIDRAKADGKFKDIERAVKEIEDSGGIVYYLCTDDAEREIKWMFFTVHDAEEDTAMPILMILRGISNGDYIEFDKIGDIDIVDEGIGTGEPSGSAVQCPLFGNR